MSCSLAASAGRAGIIGSRNHGAQNSRVGGQRRPGTRRTAGGGRVRRGPIRRGEQPSHRPTSDHRPPRRNEQRPRNERSAADAGQHQCDPPDRMRSQILTHAVMNDHTTTLKIHRTSGQGPPANISSSVFVHSARRDANGRGRSDPGSTPSAISARLPCSSSTTIPFLPPDPAQPAGGARSGAPRRGDAELDAAVIVTTALGLGWALFADHLCGILDIDADGIEAIEQRVLGLVAEVGGLPSSDASVPAADPPSDERRARTAG